MRIIIILLLYSLSLSTYGQSSQEVEKIKEEATITLDAYINYLSSLGNISESFADRNQPYREAFYKTFYSTSDETICYNDLDPEEKTSVYSSAKDYTDHVLHWYSQGLSARFIGDYQFGKVATANGISYIPVVVKKEIRGNYMQRRLQNKQYDLEFRLTYTRSSMGSISNVKIASVKPVGGGNNFKEENNNNNPVEQIYKKAREFYDQKEYTKAFPLMKQAAEEGNVDAQNKLGNMYYYGYGVTKNISTSIEWYRKAAKKDNNDIQEENKEVDNYTQEEDKEVDNYIQEEDNNNSILAEQLYKQADSLTDYAKSFPLMKQAAEKGNAEAQNALGVMYQNGYGVALDYTKAISWYKKAAQQGYGVAQFNLGYMYENGYGVALDYTKAISWYKKAAQQGDVDAQLHLALIYHNEEEIQDYAEALKWYQKAAQQGDLDAQFYLAEMYYQGVAVTKDYTEALKWFRKAAEQEGQFLGGLGTLAKYNLGYMYENGYGVTKNISMAAEWYQKAAKNGHEASQEALKRLGYK